MIPFTKMHGTGNDYICIDDRKESISQYKKLARDMCTRHYGIGSDGLLIILNSDKADFKMRMFNPDGSEAEMCGNGIRCFSKFLYDHKLTKNETISIETMTGINEVTLILKDKAVETVTVNMGEPILQRERIPMAGKPGMVINESLHLDDGIKFEITSLSMGNPHVIIFVEDIDNFPVEKYGPVIENHELFPQKTNIEFVQVKNKKEVIQRTWERGAGETLSCGTGASAVTAACILNKLTGKKLLIHLKGGELKTEWNDEDNCIYLTGPAVEVFQGQWPG